MSKTGTSGLKKKYHFCAPNVSSTVQFLQKTHKTFAAERYILIKSRRVLDQNVFNIDQVLGKRTY